MVGHACMLLDMMLAEVVKRFLPVEIPVEIGASNAHLHVRTESSTLLTHLAEALAS